MAQRLQFIISAVDKTKRAFNQVQGHVDKTQGKLKKMRPALDKIAKGFALVGAAAVVAFGVKAVKAAADFERSMANIATLVDTNTESMAEMGKKVRELSKRMPKDIGELTAALYDVRSAGISAADAMDVLETAAKLATAGLSDTKEATNLLTSAINVYGDESYDANRIAEILFKTVKYGKTTIAGLSQGFGKVAALAKEAGITIEDLSAATAILTTAGLTASESQTSLKAVITGIIKPTSDAIDVADRLGIQFDLAALQAKGLSGFLAEIAEKAGDDKQAMADLFGSVEAINTVFALTSEEGGAQYLQVLRDMETASGALDEAFLIQNATLHAQYQLLKNQLNVVFIELGTKIIPHLLDTMKFLSEMIDTATWLFGLLKGEITGVSEEMTKLEVKIMTVMETAKGAWAILSKIAKVVFEPGVGGRALIKRLGFEHGGVVPGAIGEPVAAIVHGGETIIPAGKMGVTKIIINVLGGNYLDREAGRMFGEQLALELKRNLKL